MNSGLHLSSQDELNLQPGTSHHLLLFTIPTSSEDIGGDIRKQVSHSVGLPEKAGAVISHDSKPGKVIKKS